MQKFITLLLLIMAGVTSYAQTIEERIKEISDHITLITLQEKELLKDQFNDIDEQLINGQIDAQEAERRKEEAARVSAQVIDRQTQALIGELQYVILEHTNEQILESNAIADTIEIHGKKLTLVMSKDERKELKSEKRTTSQLVLAYGLNNHIVDGQYQSSDLHAWRSRFTEIGITLKTRLSPNSSLLNFKYGFSLVYNNARPTDNRIFVSDGNLTTLQQSSQDLTRPARFRNFYINMPLHLEFDFSRPTYNSEGEKIIRSQRSWRVGVGGYAGVLVNSAQFLHYNEDGNRVRLAERGDFNVRPFNYGVSMYIARRDLGLYFKQDLQSLFENQSSPTNFSIGLRADLH
ncbi:MAG: hypothetical protein Q4F57_04675 [Weeksellaceae bacterium]|nr:hypothetical protein [Weeksellaceae bacterium]